MRQPLHGDEQVSNAQLGATGEFAQKNPSRSPWLYRGFNADTPPETFGPLTAFIDLWRLKWPQPDRFPRWRDFGFMDFEGWWGQLSLAEIHDDPLDLRWALWGTKITDWWGVDYTNKFISKIPEVHSVWQNHEKWYLERLLKERKIGFVSGTLAPQNREHMVIAGVDLPLEEDGRISHVLSAYALLEDETGFAPQADAAFTL